MLIEEQKQTIKDLEVQLFYYKHTNKELFYQNILEKYLGGTHKDLSCGQTDITTDSLHAEIKRWNCWKEGLGQLLSYNSVDPKEKMMLLCFGNYKSGGKLEATKICKDYSIEVFDCFVDKGVFKVRSMVSDMLVYSHDMQPIQNSSRA
jgi:hypothetical protein